MSAVPSTYDDERVAECLRKTALEVLPLANGISELVLQRILEKVPELPHQQLCLLLGGSEFLVIRRFSQAKRGDGSEGKQAGHAQAHHGDPPVR